MNRSHSYLLLFMLCGIGFICLGPIHADAVPMKDDPKGFEGIPWGVAFSESGEFTLVENGRRVKGYELKQGPPPWGPAPLDSMRFVTIDGEFGRVTIRYHGSDTHRQIVSFLSRSMALWIRRPGRLPENL